jgi:regulator of RNase E activity RraB
LSGKSKKDDSEPVLTEADATLLEQLSQFGVDLSEKRIIEYGFVASSVSDAESLSLCLQGIGHEFVDLPNQLDQDSNCEDRAGIWIESCELISPIDAAQKTERLRLLASEFNCKYDGWGTCIDRPVAE